MWFFLGVSQRSFESSDCTQNISSWILLLHVRSHPAFGRHVMIRHSTTLRDMARLNQTCVSGSLNSSINCPTQTEPSSQESLPKQRLIQSFLHKSLYVIFVFSASCDRRKLRIFHSTPGWGQGILTGVPKSVHF